MVIQVAEAIKLAEQDGLQSFSQGVAAKLINSYLKDRFLCGGDQEHPRIRNLHPPIDTLLLDALAQANFGEQTKEWRRLGNKGGSNFDAERYQKAIGLIRVSLPPNEPLWKIEAFWTGY